MHIEDETDIIADKYVLLAIMALQQVLNDINCYYYHTGTKEDRYAGRSAVTWVRHMKGNFRILAMALQDTPIETLHQGMMMYINKIKNYARRGIQKPNNSVQGGRISNLLMV